MRMSQEDRAIAFYWSGSMSHGRVASQHVPAMTKESFGGPVNLCNLA